MGKGGKFTFHFLRTFVKKEGQAVEEVCIHIFIVRVKSTICTSLPFTLLTSTSSSSKIFYETDRGEWCIHLCWLLLLYNMTWLGRYMRILLIQMYCVPYHFTPLLLFYCSHSQFTTENFMFLILLMDESLWKWLLWDFLVCLFNEHFYSPGRGAPLYIQWN